MSNLDNHADLIEFYRRYGEASFGADEPAYADVCRALGEHPELVELIAAHPREAQQPNLIFAAVHYLLLGGLEHPLRDVYNGRSGAEAAPLFADLVLSNRAAIDELLSTHRTQTNEVGRCAVLAVMLNHAHEAAGQPLAWVDLGTSGGLNLPVDKYHIEYNADGAAIGNTGDPDSPLQLISEVRGGNPPLRSGHAPIEWRMGVDRSPIDVSNADQARWLQACLWPSKTERAARLAAAIRLTQNDPPEILHADAVDGIMAAIDQAPADAALVVTTSWVWYYLPREVQQQVLDVMRASSRRIRWYSLEGSGVVAELAVERDRHAVESVLGLVEVGGDQRESSTVLGLTHPHGDWFTWQ